MNKLLLIGLFLYSSTSIFSQINMADSTVGIVGYWNLYEKQSYTISKEKFKIEDADTTSYDYFTYQVDITILDSTDNSFTIEWFYRNFETTSTDPIAIKFSKIIENFEVIIKTDEFGGIIELVNWKELRDYVFEATSLLKEEYKDSPDINEIAKKVENNYLNKENIESGSIKDILQFYYFHGGLYKLNDVLEAQIQLPNLYGGNPFDADVSIWLDEINAEDYNSVLRTTQSVDSEQLTDATYLYLKELTPVADSTFPARKDFSPLYNDTWTVSRIHESWWVLYSVETKETTTGNVINVENRIIEIH